MALVNSTDITAHQLDYAKFNYGAPYYKYTRLPPMSGSTSLTFGPTDSQETIMEIPAKVFNPARTILTFTEQMSAMNAKFLYLFEDVVRSISQIQLITRGGQIIADANFVQNNSKVVRKMQTKLQTFLGNSYMEKLYPNNSLGSVVSAVRVGANVVGTAFKEDGINYTGEKTLSVGGSNAATPAAPVRHQYRLGDICKDTPLAVDKDYYASGEALILRILWGPGSKVGFGGNSNADPTTLPVIPTSNTTIDHISLMLAVQSNKDIADSIIARGLSPEGYSMLVPYTHSQKLNLRDAGQHNITIRMNRVHGRSLVKVVVSAFNATESSITAYDNSNNSEAAKGIQKISSYYTSLDSNKIQEFAIDCTEAKNRFDDWILHKDMLEGSMIQNKDHYYDNSFHCDDFTHISSLVDPELPVSKDNILVGLPLDVEKRYDFTANANVSLNYYTWTTTQRLLVFQPHNIRFE